MFVVYGNKIYEALDYGDKVEISILFYNYKISKDKVIELKDVLPNEKVIRHRTNWSLKGLQAYIQKRKLRELNRVARYGKRFNGKAK